MRNTRSALRAYSERWEPEVSTQRGFSFLDWKVQNKINFWFWLTFFLLRIYRLDRKFEFKGPFDFFFSLSTQLFKYQSLIKCYYFQVHMRMLTEKRQRQKAERRWTMCIFPLDYVSRHKTKLPSCVCEVPREWHTHELLLQLTHNKDEINVLSAAYRWTSGLWPWYQHYLPQPGNSLAILQVSGCPDVMPRIKCCQALGGGGNSAQSRQNNGPSKMIPSWSWTILIYLLLEIRLLLIPTD